MKKFTCILIIFVASIIQLKAQSTLTDADLPHANDIFRVSVGQITAGIDVSLTGPSFSWDFSSLIPSSQRIDSFVDEAATNALFSIVFIDNSFNNNRANQATPSGDFNLGTLISLTGVYNFYYNSSASYKQVGLGANVNGIPLPITYSPHDIVYKLPLQYPSSDSSASGYVIDLTSTLGIYYKVNKTRNNEVDGWGSLTTPFGTFDVLRVHSTVVQRDSLYLDTLGAGFNFPPLTTHEYKWLGTGQGIPLLQMNTSAGGVVTQILYKDSLRSLVGIDELNPVDQSFKVFPNPTSAQFTLSFELLKFSVVEMQLISLDGKQTAIIDTKIMGAGTHDIKVDVSEKKLATGNYIVRLLVNGSSFVRPLVVTTPR